ncbi:MAG TPA: DNA gyrase inhibitor YacG [Rhodospirillaceae bacterium]|nr:MAG: hypothetical protein A2018_03065 [Alphaproteobacteria bacterium GWF2_58_20]HAU29373.1 DNA gyrase inhibitor YacG [Rhodospirillaceae bacterium]
MKKECPICGQPAAEGSPFCSSRCAYVDLGHWLSGSYRIPTNEVPEEDVDTDTQNPYTDGSSQESGR